MENFWLNSVNRIVPMEESEHGHYFGGKSDHELIYPNGIPLDIHLVYNLNLNDPLLGLTIPNLNWLPLYYPFYYNGSDLSYQVMSDSQVKSLRNEKRRR